MKGTLLRVFSAIMVMVLFFSVIWVNGYTQERTAEDAKAKVHAEKLAAEQSKKREQLRAEEQKKLEKQMEAAAEQERQMKTYSLQEADAEDNLFTNKVDGYSILIPKDMKADMKYSNVRAVLESDHLTLEIYRQQIETTSGASIQSYTNYSNEFINNRIDHTKQLQGKTRINGRTVSFLQWSRRHLINIKNDKCYYASVDVSLSEHEVVTFLFKSNQNFTNKSYLEIIKSLKTVKKTAEPYMEKIHQVENPNWDEKTAAAYETYFGENSRLHWGIFENNAPVDFTELDKIEQRVDFTFPILLYYTPILENKDNHPNLAIALANAKSHDRMLELTLQTIEQTPGKGNMVYDVLDGKYDTYLKNYAKEVADYGEPILFRLGNEMNGDWCVYSAHSTSRDTEIYKAFYRYIYGLFKEAGADNVIWVWNPNGKPFPDFKWNDELCYYPGDEYVDVIGMTSYNTGTYYKDEKWLEFDQMYDSLYQKYTERYDKPLMITEFSSSSVGGSKEQWVANMFQHIKQYDRIKVAIWWDGCDWDADGNIARSYFIDETDQLVQVFREDLAQYKEEK